MYCLTANEFVISVKILEITRSITQLFYEVSQHSPPPLRNNPNKGKSVYLHYSPTLLKALLSQLSYYHKCLFVSVQTGLNGLSSHTKHTLPLFL